MTDDDIRELHNTFADGTATDAVARHRCRVALGERCIGWDGPDHARYPTNLERNEARAWCRQARKERPA